MITGLRSRREVPRLPRRGERNITRRLVPGHGLEPLRAPGNRTQPLASRPNVAVIRPRGPPQLRANLIL